MDYTDQVLAYLLRLRPGEKVNVNTANDPKKFVSAVKLLMDDYGFRQSFSFNADYSVLRRNYDLKPQKQMI